MRNLDTSLDGDLDSLLDGNTMEGNGAGV